jgi:2-dehydro-3-deoxy-D-arabinonate dehydratase
MKLYKTTQGNVLETNKGFFLLPEKNWDKLINNDNLFADLHALSEQLPPFEQAQKGVNEHLQAPVSRQELWASGVTYFRSKQGRQEEASASGGADFYQRVYEAPRPELFFKASANRIAGHGQPVRIRRDSTWDVPEPELVLVITAKGKIIGYSIGNDMSSRSIEGENPLYLPQAKTYDGCAALGPCILVVDQALPAHTCIRLKIVRDEIEVFTDKIAINQIKREFSELVEYLYRECSFPDGALLMTGTGIVPDSGFTLQIGDEITIEIDGIGKLINQVQA